MTKSSSKDSIQWQRFRESGIKNPDKYTDQEVARYNVILEEEIAKVQKETAESNRRVYITCGVVLLVIAIIVLMAVAA